MSYTDISGPVDGNTTITRPFNLAVHTQRLKQRHQDPERQTETNKVDSWQGHPKGGHYETDKREK